MFGRLHIRWRYITLALTVLVVSSIFAFGSSIVGVSGGVAHAAAGCTGTDAAAGSDCSTIPLGCPGSSLKGPFDPANVKNCPYVSTTDGVGCKGSNAPLNTDCSTIPLGCPGSTTFGASTLNTLNCPYSSVDLVNPVTCKGTDAPSGTDCSTIPLGCPGSTLTGSFNSSSVGTCPYISTTSGIGCKGSNAPLKTDCSKIPLGCPGSSLQGPTGATPTNCPYSGSDIPAASTSGRPDCNVSDDPLTVILCPIYDALTNSADWIFNNILTPFLVTEPVGTSTSDPSFQIWSNFRLYGDILLVGFVLVAVFGEIITGGESKKINLNARSILPNALFVGILINTSVYWVAALVDFSNVVGRTIGDVLTQPIRASGQWNFTPNGIQSLGVFGVGLLGLFLGAGGIAGFLGGIFQSNVSGTAGFAKIALYAAFWVALPIFLGVLAVFITLVVRKGLILFLIMISPVAFSLYALPNTRQYFQKWWNLLLEALMVYPIIVVVFAVADILSIMILASNSISKSVIATGFTSSAALTADQIIAIIVAFLLQFLPLVGIPYAFRIAGGTLAKAHEAITGAGSKLNELSASKKERAKDEYRGQSLQARERVQNKIDAFGNRNGWARSIPVVGTKALGNRVGGYNLQQELSARRAMKQKEIQDQIATGDDTEIRALTVDKLTARNAGQLGAADKDGWRSNGQYRVNDRTGVEEFKTLGGRWVSESSVDRAHQRWHGDQAVQQEALSYEMKKATTQQEIDGLTSNYGNIARSWGLNDGQAAGMWKGAAFANQGANLEYKYHGFKNGKLTTDGIGLMREIDEKKGSYDMSKMSAETWVTMQQQVKVTQENMTTARITQHNLSEKVGRGEALTTEEQQASKTAAATLTQGAELLQRASRIARTYTQQRGMGGSGPIVNPETGAVEGDYGIPTTGPTGGREQGFVTSIHGASGRVQEEAENFVHLLHPEVETARPATYAPGFAGQPEASVLVGGAPASNPANTGRDRPNVRANDNR